MLYRVSSSQGQAPALVDLAQFGGFFYERGIARPSGKNAA
jgi:hypothetical protein